MKSNTTLLLVGALAIAAYFVFSRAPTTLQQPVPGSKKGGGWSIGLGFSLPPDVFSGGGTGGGSTAGSSLWGDSAGEQSASSMSGGAPAAPR